jgi:hypothetical protein
MKLYVYCLAEQIDTLAPPVSGISNAKVEVLNIEGFALLVSKLDNETVPVSRENALTHAAVVRSVLDRATPLPVRFGTLVTEQQLRSYVTTHREALEANLAKVRGCVEMSVKIIWDSGDNSGDETDPEPESSKIGTGAAFLKQKHREILGGELRATRAREVAEWLRAEVGAHVREEQITLCPTEKLVLAAAHLVERGAVQHYRDRLAEARKQRPELHFLASGPWPPYSFSNIDLEFKSRFGVS